MKRRNFILASGSTVLSGMIASRIQRPAIGLNFEISTPDKDPSKVDSLVIEFETLEITPKYLDEKEPVSVQAKVEVAGRVKKSDKVQASIVNGESKELESSIDSIVIDGLNASSTISGEVTVSIDHSDVQDSYSRQFNITGSGIPDSVVVQYDASNFTQGEATWPADVGPDMSITGDPQTETLSDGSVGVRGDGVDDYGEWTAPSSLEGSSLHQFSIEFGIQFTQSTVFAMGNFNGDNETSVVVDFNKQENFNDEAGNFRFFLRSDGGNNFAVSPTNNPNLDDGNLHKVSIIVTGTDPVTDTDIIIDGTQVNTSAGNDSIPLDNYGQQDLSQAVFAFNNEGSIGRYGDVAYSIIRWHDSAITEQTI
jgi:hypothetical protein